MRTILVMLTAMLVLGALPLRTQAQDAERPVAFDTAGRIASISPSLAARLSLNAPAWPVTGDYVEARLFERSAGDFVIAAQRPDGSITRYTITAAGRQAIADAIAAGMVTTGGLTATDRSDLISESAGSSFARSQLAAGLLVYGPSLAALSDGSSSGAMYFLGAGAAYFIASGISRSQTVTRSQNILATDGAIRGAILAQGVHYAIAGDNDDGNEGRTAAVLALAGGLTGTIGGFQAGRGLTDGEAASATLGSTTSAAVTAGLIGASAGLEDAQRGKVAAIVTGALAGYPLGLWWIRCATYRVTTGDVSAQWTGALVGTLASMVLLPWDSDGGDGRVTSAILTTGYLGGLFATNRALAKPFDLTDDQATALRWSSIAGAAIGLGVAAAAKVNSERAVFGLMASGATLGMLSAWPRNRGQPHRSSSRVPQRR